MGGSGKVNSRRSNSTRKVNKKNDKKGSPGTGKFLERQSKNNDDADLEIKDKEFDFQEKLKRFDMSTMKEALANENKDGDDGNPEDKDESTKDNGSDKDDDKKEVKEETEKEEKPPAYKHDNFFDTLSTDRE